MIILSIAKFLRRFSVSETLKTTLANGFCNKQEKKSIYCLKIERYQKPFNVPRHAFVLINFPVELVLLLNFFSPRAQMVYEPTIREA